jgi:hypothetical protein
MFLRSKIEAVILGRLIALKYASRAVVDDRCESFINLYPKRHPVMSKSVYLRIPTDEFQIILTTNIFIC